jgi:pimeloyl-ACP methyl ester carboxylesterase
VRSRRVRLVAGALARAHLTAESERRSSVLTDFQTADVRTGETTIFVRRSGSGPPILLLHGFPQTHLMWRSVAPLLARRFTVVCADLRGYGRSQSARCRPFLPGGETRRNRRCSGPLFRGDFLKGERQGYSFPDEAAKVARVTRQEIYGVERRELGAPEARTMAGRASEAAFPPAAVDRAA